MHHTWILPIFIASLFVGQSFKSEPANAAEQTTQQWRQEREANLKKEDGWLSLIGLFWLKEGPNTVGGSRSDLVQFPQDAIPRGHRGPVGTFELKDGQASFIPANDVSYELNGKVFAGKASEKIVLHSDETSEPDTLKIGRVRLLLIKRSLGLGIRMKDPEAATRKNFKGLKWYPVNQAYRFKAKFIPFSTPKKIQIPDILGGTSESESPGEVSFTLDGKEQRLIAVTEGDELFFIFKDTSNGSTTYSSGRFLNTPKPKDGFVDLDFNRAYTPPCGFTRFATCPLPPRENFIKTPIPAGEKFSGHPH